MTSTPGLVRLASETEAFCRVVTPDDARWRDLGHKFCVRVREYTRTEPTQVTPEELTEEDYARYNLVLFGSILNNTAILRLYARGRCFTDASYPGRDGAEIRALLNPLGAGRDVVLIGGSDYAAVHEAAIGLNRTFTDVTTEVDGVLCLHRLNFCVAADHPAAGPAPGEVQRALDIAAGDPTASIAAATTFALNHYRSDDPAWADAVTRALLPVIATGDLPRTVGGLALSWGLVHAFPGYAAGFRSDVDDLLTRAAQASADRLHGEDERALADVVDDCMSVIRVADHLESVRGERPWPEQEARAWAQVLRGDPGIGADGLRHWRSVDTWLGAALRAERYDLLGGGILGQLTLDAVAERDNLGAPVGDLGGGEHAENALRKIAAYEDSGEPLWLRRWMQDSTPGLVQSGPPSAWHTGAYAPDRAPTPARDIPRLHVATADGPTGGVRLVAMRRDLDAGGEYAAFRGERLALARFTWNGHTWLTGEPSGEPQTPGIVAYDVLQADLDGLGYVSAADRESAWRREIVWRHAAFVVIADHGRPGDGVEELHAAEGVVRESGPGDTGYVLRRGASTVGVTQLSIGSGRAVSIIALGAVGSSRVDGNALSLVIGEASCYVRDAVAEGVRVRAACTVLDGDAAWAVGFERLEVDGVVELASTAPVQLRLCPSRGTGRVHADGPCRLTWNRGADGIELDAGAYDIELHEFNWAGLARLSVG